MIVPDTMNPFEYFIECITRGFQPSPSDFNCLVDSLKQCNQRYFNQANTAILGLSHCRETSVAQEKLAQLKQAIAGLTANVAPQHRIEFVNNELFTKLVHSKVNGINRRRLELNNLKTSNNYQNLLIQRQAKINRRNRLKGNNHANAAHHYEWSETEKKYIASAPSPEAEICDRLTREIREIEKNPEYIHGKALQTKIVQYQEQTQRIKVYWGLFEQWFKNKARWDQNIELIKCLKEHRAFMIATASPDFAKDVPNFLNSEEISALKQISVAIQGALEQTYDVRFPEINGFEALYDEDNKLNRGEHAKQNALKCLLYVLDQTFQDLYNDTQAKIQSLESKNQELSNQLQTLVQGSPEAKNLFQEINSNLKRLEHLNAFKNCNCESSQQQKTALYVFIQTSVNNALSEVLFKYKNEIAQLSVQWAAFKASQNQQDIELDESIGAQVARGLTEVFSQSPSDAGSQTDLHEVNEDTRDRMNTLSAEADTDDTTTLEPEAKRARVS